MKIVIWQSNKDHLSSEPKYQNKFKGYLKKNSKRINGVTVFKFRVKLSN